jgi:hypothetical protein
LLLFALCAPFAVGDSMSIALNSNSLGISGSVGTVSQSETPDISGVFSFRHGVCHH